MNVTAIQNQKQTSFEGMKLGQKTKLGLASAVIVPLLSLAPIKSNAQDSFEKEPVKKEVTTKKAAISTDASIILGIISAIAGYIISDIAERDE